MIEDDSEHPEFVCAHCGAKLTLKRPWQRFCSNACRFADWNERNPRQRVITKQPDRIETKLDVLFDTFLNENSATDCIRSRKARDYTRNRVSPCGRGKPLFRFQLKRYTPANRRHMIGSFTRPSFRTVYHSRSHRIRWNGRCLLCV